MKIKRRYLGDISRRAFDEMIAQNFLAAYGNFGSYFIYNSFGSEASTKLIIDELLSQQKPIFLPRVEGENIVAVPYGKTKLGSFGIEEPLGDSVSVLPDLCVIPLLAVNERGYRLGYGGGYYDRYLKDKLTLKVGIGYDFQIADFEEEPFDVPLNSFVSERGIYHFGTKE